MQFAVKISLPADLPTGFRHYSAYRMGNRISIMTDYSGGTLTLELPGGQSPLAITRRKYNALTARWGPERVVTGVPVSAGPDGKVRVQFADVERKALTIVEVRP